MRHEDVDEAVRRAVALAGGLEAIQPGDTVFIKPNAVHGFVDGYPGVVTDPAVLAAVIALVRERKPGRVTVGDRSARGFESDLVLRMNGQREAALAAGADEVFAAPSPVDAPDEWVLLQPPHWEETWQAQGGVLAMRRIVEADHFINVPVCKDHRWAVHSLTMKNLIGAVGDTSRDPMHYIKRTPDRLARDIAILNQMFTPLMNVVDARTILVNGGPEGILPDRVAAEPGLVLAGRDRVSTDAAGVALIQLELGRATVAEPDDAHAVLTGEVAWRMPQLLHAIELGLGATSAAEVALRLDGLGDDAAALESLFRAG